MAWRRRGGVVCPKQRRLPVSRSIAFATFATRPEGEADDRLTLAPLERRGIAVTPVVWNDPQADWTRFDAVVVRSTWDYFHHLDDFLAWIDRVEALRVPLLNPPSILRPNTDKAYLKQLADAGVPIVPTAWPNGGKLADVLAEAGWSEAVVKPAVSGGAFETWRVAAETAEAEQARYAALQARGPVLVQPYLPEIETGGEASLVFFNGRFSHALVKRPRAGDFRVQPQYGGQQVGFLPDAALAAQASAVLAHLPEVPLYARVDGVVRDGTLLLMELELVEPHLYMGTSEGAAERFAEAIAERVG